MNKNALIVITIGAIAFISALLLINFNKSSTNNTPVNEENQSEKAPFADAMNENTESVIKSGLNLNEIAYQISSGEVLYGANKQFLGKDAENIVGRTEDIQGTGYWNKDTNEIDAAIAVNLSALATDNGQRDSEVQKLFTDKIATFRINPTKVDNITLGNNFETQMTGMMTINGQSKEVTFDVNGVVTETTFTIEGTTNLKMSDFGIDAPSMAGVFTVADELPVSFKVSGEAITTNDSTSDTSEQELTTTDEQ